MTASLSPESWVSTNFGSILELKYGKSLPAKDRDGEGAPVYGSNGIVGLHSSPFVPREGVVVGRKGSFGEVHISTKPFSPIDTTYYIDETWGLPLKYWYYQLRCLPLTQLNRSSAIPGLNREDAYAQEIFLPPRAEQQQIVARLDALLAQVDTLKTRLDIIPDILKRFRQSVLAAAVSGRLTEEWRETAELKSWVAGKLGDFVQKPTYGTSSKSQKEGDVPVLRMGNIQNGKLDWTNLVYTSDITDIEKYWLQKGDVLFNRTNSPELVGKTSIFRGERKAIYAGYLIKVRCKNELNPEFLNHHLNSLGASQYCYSVKSDGVSQSNINAQKLIAYPMNKPPIEEQTEIVRRIEQLFAFAEQIEQRVKVAQSLVNHLTQSILAKAFRGELTAEWREQNLDLISGVNSAKALLEQIKADREETVSAKKNNRKGVKTKVGKNMKPKQVISITEALKAAGTPLAAQVLLTQSGYSSDASTEELEHFFLDIREQLKLGSILRERSGDGDIFVLAK